MAKAVIFDFDGTIADTLSLVLEIGMRIAGEEGQEIPPKEELRNLDSDRLFEIIPISKVKLPFYVKKIRKEVTDRMDEVDIFAGMKEVIQELSKNYELGVITSNSEEAANQFLEDNGLAECFEHIIGGIALFGKSGKIKKMVKKLGVNKEEAVYVADGEKDIEACKDDEVKIISVTWGYNDKEVLEQANPDFIADSPKDIIRIVNELSKDET